MFDFVNPVLVQSFDIVDGNGGFRATVILTDQSLATRTFIVNQQFSQDINTCGVCNGYETLDLTNLGVQVGEGGGSASGSDSLGFDASDVIKLEIRLDGTPSSGDIDNLTFVPEPSSAALLGAALALLGLRRQRRRA